MFGSANDRFLKSIAPIVEEINAKEDEMRALSDYELRQRTPWLISLLQQGKSLDDILPDAFATVREASRRILGMRHFDVQLMGGIVLHRGMITEMKTGEGKTLVATLPSYLNALTQKGVHIITVNEYLAKRDAEWMGEMHNFLGLSVGCIYGTMSDEERRNAYDSSITYGTNSEFGFDYLRDNTKIRADDMCQRPLNYAIIDEIDSVAIDEARTPLIISGESSDMSDLFKKVDRFIPRLSQEDYQHDIKHRSVTLKDTGIHKLENMLTESGLIEGGLYDIKNIAVLHHMNQALKAHVIFSRDIDYIVSDDKVVLVDDFTGRTTPGRQYSDGLHQAIEAKEGVTISPENKTIASITLQNYFRMYEKLSGMTGTASTEAVEFSEIYDLDVISIPSNKPFVRKDHNDIVYLNQEDKDAGFLEFVKERYAKKQPILVGTTSVENSEHLSDLLSRNNIKHNVLNARHHEQEADTIAEAGKPGAVTVATNMAGRGTDIKLQGDSLERGGLLVIGYARNESRRIDDQLRGRSGRQGDPGESKFFISLDDDLMKRFGGERLKSMLSKLGMKKGDVIEHKMVTNTIERSQKKVEEHNYDIRRQLLKYDDIDNKQRSAFYKYRTDILLSFGKSGLINMACEIIQDILQEHFTWGEDISSDKNCDDLEMQIGKKIGIDMPITNWVSEKTLMPEKLGEKIRSALEGMEIQNDLVNMIAVRTIDDMWHNHITTLGHLRQGINLRGYGQKNPLNEYGQEAFKLFESLINNFSMEICKQTFCFMAIMKKRDEETARNAKQQAVQDLRANEAIDESRSPESNASQQNMRRNAPCHCGSGIRFKHCHGHISGVGCEVRR